MTINYCRIVDGECVDNFISPNEFGFTLEESWHPDIAKEFVVVPAGVKRMDRLVDGKWIPYVEPVEPT